MLFKNEKVMSRERYCLGNSLQLVQRHIKHASWKQALFEVWYCVRKLAERMGLDGAYVERRSGKYDGVPEERVLWISVASFYLMVHFTGSQWALEGEDFGLQSLELRFVLAGDEVCI